MDTFVDTVTTHDFEAVFGHLAAAAAILQERRDFTCDGDDECLDSYRVALACVAKAAKAIQHCQALEARGRLSGGPLKPKGEYDRRFA